MPIRTAKSTSFMISTQGDTSHSKAMSAYLWRTPKYEKIVARFFWYWIFNNVVGYVQNFYRCKRQSGLPPNVNNKMHNVQVSQHVMKQVG